MNPKDLAAQKRVPMHLLPAAGAINGALACLGGARDYGPYNWRQKPISLMEYIGAIERHIARLKDGEDHDPKSGVHHLGHINATTSIILDALLVGTLIDDRPVVKGQASHVLEEFEKWSLTGRTKPGTAGSTPPASGSPGPSEIASGVETPSEGTPRLRTCSEL